MNVYLKSLEISGFKSFGTRSYIEFPKGITGIVGPNGCGKSNIIESIKWVLGEQSAKSLRGEKMQDIIFAGTKHRSPSGMADITLTFNNDSQWLPLDFPEISIGRRVFRSGESQYFVNGIRSRLKDTTELFLDTGVGKDSYAIFEQGKIDRLLSESPEDRRVLFEDFAGISKFKFRKEEAEKKLSQAKENLEKLQETLDRLEKEISSLESQASDAENYNLINAELRQMEKKFEVARIENMKREISNRQNELATLKEILEPLMKTLNEHEDEIKLSDERLAEKEKLFSEINQKNIQLEKDLSACKIRYESAKKNHKNISDREKESAIEFKYNIECIEEWEETLEEKKNDLYDAEKKYNNIKNNLNDIEALQEELKKKSEHIEEDLLKDSKDIGFIKIACKDDMNSLRNKNSELQGQIFVQESEILRLESERNNKNDILIKENKELMSLRASLKELDDQKNAISIEKNIILTEIENIEKKIYNTEKTYTSILNTSKICDEKILSTIDEHIKNLKMFENKKNLQQKELLYLLNKIEEYVNSDKLIDKNIFKELYDAVKNQESIYKNLLDNMFGENGIFSEKILLSKNADSLSNELRELREELINLRNNLNFINEKESIIFKKLTELESFCNSSEKDYIKTQKDITEISEKLGLIKNNFEKIKQDLNLNHSKLIKTEQLINRYDQQLHEMHQEHYKLQENLTHTRINVHTSETEVYALKNNIKSLEEKIEALNKQSEKITLDQSKNKKMLKELEEEMEDLLTEQDEISPELLSIAEQLKQNITDIADLRETKRILEHMHRDNIQKYTKLKIQESEIEGFLAERMETLKNMKDQLQFQDGDIILEKNESTENLNHRIRSHREKLNKIGNVNLLAIEQLQSLKEQYTKLIFQKEDIDFAAKDTEALILDTNKESSDRFIIAFEEIRKSFKDLFSELFNGGKADLILKNSRDPLNSGIDIMAEPPGQKFQNISLLSGGQRAMVAIAVIFSILELKPTPFVILDEMDAPLDDENIERFKRLLLRFKKNSQFVVVSHSKSTLEVCDVLFGITMEELGCSKILSVAFDETENLLFA